MCEGGGEAEFDPKELLCSGCTEFSAQENCKIHGKEFMCDSFTSLVKLILENGSVASAVTCQCGSALVLHIFVMNVTSRL